MHTVGGSMLLPASLFTVTIETGYGPHVVRIASAATAPPTMHQCTRREQRVSVPSPYQYPSWCTNKNTNKTFT